MATIGNDGSRIGALLSLILLLPKRMGELKAATRAAATPKPAAPAAQPKAAETTDEDAP